MRRWSILLSVMAAGPALAQEAPLPDPAAMAAIEADVPPQSWYPDGYYDIRIAAEAQIAEMTPPATAPVAADGLFNLMACSRGQSVGDWDDPVLERQGEIALATARLRSDLARRNYPAALYGAPLLAFERDRLVAVLPDDYVYSALAAALEAERAGAAADLPPVAAFDPCPPPPPAPPPPPPPPEVADERPGIGKPVAAKPATKPAKPAATAAMPKASPPKAAATAQPRPKGVTFATMPAAAEVLLINAFAFKVCMRKQANPWDRFACRWNEVETGIAKPLSGRFVYQVRWPDGTVRKGTREIAPGPAGAATVTFRKEGS